MYVKLSIRLPNIVSLSILLGLSIITVILFFSVQRANQVTERWDEERATRYSALK